MPSKTARFPGGLWAALAIAPLLKRSAAAMAPAPRVAPPERSIPRAVPWVLLALIGSAGFLCAPAAAEENRVRNPGFEEGNGAAAHGWRGLQNAGAPTFERTREAAHGGT